MTKKEGITFYHSVLLSLFNFFFLDLLLILLNSSPHANKHALGNVTWATANNGWDRFKLSHGCSLSLSLSLNILLICLPLDWEWSYWDPLTSFWAPLLPTHWREGSTPNGPLGECRENSNLLYSKEMTVNAYCMPSVELHYFKSTKFRPCKLDTGAHHPYCMPPVEPHYFPHPINCISQPLQ